MKFDLECFVDSVEVFLKSKLNDRILLIDAEKNLNKPVEDHIITEAVNECAYVFQSLDNLALNFDPILFYGVAQVPSKGIGPATAKNPKIEISVIKQDSSLGEENKVIGKQLLRYQRALEEIFEENFYKINSVRPKIEVSSLQPISFQMQNSSDQFKAIGIEIEIFIF